MTAKQVKDTTSRITNNTTVSVSVLLAIVGGLFWLVTNMVQVRADTDTNTRDITAILAKLDTQTKTNQDLNENIIKLNGRLDNFNTRLDALTAQSGTTPAPVIVHTTTTTPAEGQPTDTSQNGRNNQPRTVAQLISQLNKRLGL